MEAIMKTVTLQVATLDEVKQRLRNAFKGKKQGSYISFATPELLFRLLTAKRWELIRALTGAGPVTIREAARRVGRDVKAVHGDVHALLRAGVLRKDDEGLIVFPFDAIRVDVMLHAA
jgi:predicted transcriptional regulator